MSEEKPELPDFEAMPFEELITTKSKSDNDKFNDALWLAQSERCQKLNIAPLDDFENVDEYQNEMDARLKKLEAKFKALVKLIEESGLFDMPRISLDQYLEDEVK